MTYFMVWVLYRGTGHMDSLPDKELDDSFKELKKLHDETYGGKIKEGE